MCCIALVRCVLVLRWYPYAGFILHNDTTQPQPNHTVTTRHIEPEQYNTWNKSTISRKLLKMDVLTFETCWAVNNEIIKQVISSCSVLIQVHCHEIGKLWIPTGRQDSFKQQDLWMENKLDATNIFVLVKAFLCLYVYFVRSSSTSFSFVFFY